MNQSFLISANSFSQFQGNSDFRLHVAAIYHKHGDFLSLTILSLTVTFYRSVV